MLEPAPLVRPLATTDSLTHTAFYQVALKCPAAPEIACGSGSKPVLSDLESAAAVAGVWLHRSGTELAIQWQPATPAAQRETVLNEVFAANATVGTLPVPLQPEAGKPLSDPEAWYASAQLDNLTQEEAGIIARRLLHRMQAGTVLSPEQQHAFLDQFTCCFVRHFAVGTAALRTISGTARVAEVNEDILQSLLQNFAGPQRAALEQALATGYLAVPGDPDYSDTPEVDCCTIIEGL